MRLCLRHELSIYINDNKAVVRGCAFGINRGVTVAGGAFCAGDCVFYAALNFCGAELHLFITFRAHKAVCHSIVHVFHRLVADKNVYVFFFCGLAPEPIPHLISEAVYVFVAIGSVTMWTDDTVDSVVFNVLSGE